ncbi:MAG: ATP-grasp domain-containing protein [Actinobacteria bacterium]|nr:ATP-grasp domain-containing protein [Actinomycetota bacterium]
MSTVLIVFQNPRLPYIFEAASRLDLEVVRVFEERHAPRASVLATKFGHHEPLFADWATACAPESRELDAIARSHGVDAVLTLDEPTVPAVAALADRLGLAGPGVEPTVRARSKHLRSAALDPLGLSARSTTLPLDSTERSLRTALSALGGDVVVKPTSGYAGSGVVRVRDGADLGAAVATVRALYDGVLTAESLVNGAAGRALEIGGISVEEFLPGQEFAVEVAADATGRAIAVSWGSKGLPTGPHFQESPYVVPAQLDEDATRRLLGAAEAAVTGLGLSSCVAHVEVRLDPQGDPRVIDLGLRVGGSGVVDWLSTRAFGVSVCETALLLALGVDAGLTRPGDPNGVAANYVIPVDGHGTFLGVDRLSDVLSGAHAEYVGLTDPGTVVAPWPTWSGYIGFVLSTHPSIDDALDFHRSLAGLTGTYEP